MPKPVMVDRCVCHDVSFATVLDWARSRDSTTVDDAKAQFGCTGSCGMCRRYLTTSLETGEPRVPLVLQQDKPGA